MPARPRHSRVVARALLTMGVSVSLLTSTHVTAADSRGIAFFIVDLQSGATLASTQPDVAQRPLLAGSVMKVVAVAAALEAGSIDARTRIVCTRSVVVDGHRLTCTHPDLHRPLTASEALTHSCNVYVATVASRLPRAALDRTLAGLGLPPSSGTASVPASSLGLEGTRVLPRALVTALARVANRETALPWKPATLDVIRDGLRGAAHDGTASALGAAGIDALAKTGTVDAGGVSQGLVVGVTPSIHPTLGFALIASGGAGRDAASLMAARLRELTAKRGADASMRGSVGASTAPVAPSGRTQTSASGVDRRGRTASVVRVGIAQSNGTYRVKEMPLDEYVAGVVAGEAAPGSAAAALDALAIAVRTYTLANRGRHAADGFDLCDLTHCQVLRGASGVTEDAALRTTGRFLADRGEPAHIFYNASCGGFSERASSVWRGSADPSFLPSKPDPACVSESAWHDEIASKDLLRVLRAGGFRGDGIRNVSIIDRSSSGRAAWMRIEGMTPAEISGDNLRTLVGRTLGWQHLRSTRFEVTRTDSGFAFSGAGAGHGVGMCVVGSVARARSGSSAEEILQNYFPGLTFATLDGSDLPMSVVRITLPQQDEPLRSTLQTIASTSFRLVGAALGTPTTTPVVLRFHPTIESYQRATGQPWYTSGSTRGHTIDLLPAPVLRQRGLLDATLRHELAHAITGDRLQGAPVWVHEGVAVWASRGRSRGGSPSRASRPATAALNCPADSAFSNASSAEALRRLYEVAEQCYVRDQAAGRSWRTWVRSAN